MYLPFFLLTTSWNLGIMTGGPAIFKNTQIKTMKNNGEVKIWKEFGFLITSLNCNTKSGLFLNERNKKQNLCVATVNLGFL